MARTYIIAEIGNSHEGSVGLAKQLIKAAAECGVDAVKMQTHIFDAESLSDAPNPPYFKDETRKAYFERTAFSIEQWSTLKDYSEIELGIDFFSSPFSLEAVDLLEKIEVQTYKIASGEVSNLPLLEKIGQTGKRVLLSSGMSNWRELDDAVETLRSNGCKDLVVLQCTSEYPCPPQEAGLNVLDEIKERYPDVTVGYSDHTMGIVVPLAAVIKGAMVIEKHFTLSRKMYGSDAMNSTEPDEFQSLVDDIRKMEIALTHKVDKDQKVNALGQMKLTFEKSIVSAHPLNKDHIICREDLAFKKPGDGIPAKKYQEIIGKTVNKPISEDYKFSENDFYE